MSKQYQNMFALKANGTVAEWFLDTDDRKIAQIRLDELVKLRDEEYGIKQPLSTPQTKGTVPFQTRALSNLKSNPSQLLFARLYTDRELSDEWYTSTFLHLFSTIKYFSQKYFGMDMLTQDFSPWKQGDFSEPFLRYAAEVACPDPVATWDSLLMKSRQKSSLVCGIFMKALMDTVFTDLLFGASHEQIVLLKVHDETTLNLDGYKRTARRAALVRDFLGSDITTPRFWLRVDELATDMVWLFLPLINMQGRAAPADEWPELEEIHQQIFHIVSIAAYFSIIIRSSETIIDLAMSSVGVEWSHLEVDDNSSEYHNSRVAVVEQDDHEEAKAKADKSLAEARAQMPQGQLSFIRNILGSDKVVEYRRPIRTAKVRIAMFPRIKRYRTRCDPERWNKWLAEEESLIFKSRVIFYYGKEQDPLRLEKKPSLAEYRMTEWEKLRAKYSSPRHWLLLLTLVILLLQLWQPWVFVSFKAALYALALLVVTTVKRICVATFRTAGLV